MITKFQLEKFNSKYNYYYYEPESAVEWLCKSPTITVFEDCRDIRKLIPFHFSPVMPSLLELRVSSEFRKGYRLLQLKMEKDGMFSFEGPGRILGRKTVSFSLFTKYLLPIALCYHRDGRPTSIWHIYLKFIVIK